MAGTSVPLTTAVANRFQSLLYQVPNLV
jgi:hypothetical protein